MSWCPVLPLQIRRGNRTKVEMKLNEKCNVKVKYLERKCWERKQFSTWFRIGDESLQYFCLLFGRFLCIQFSFVFILDVFVVNLQWHRASVFFFSFSSFHSHWFAWNTNNAYDFSVHSTRFSIWYIYKCECVCGRIEHKWMPKKKKRIWKLSVDWSALSSQRSTLHISAVQVHIQRKCCTYFMESWDSATFFMYVFVCCSVFWCLTSFVLPTLIWIRCSVS